MDKEINSNGVKNKMLVGFIIAIVVVGAGSFYGGMLYGKSQAVGARNLSAQQRQQRFAGQGGQFNRQAGPGAPGQSFVNGNIIAKDDISITVKLADGGLTAGQAGSKIIFLSAKTNIMKSVDGSTADLEMGKNVMVTGSVNSDGSLTAGSIQLRPAPLINAISTPKQ